MVRVNLAYSTRVQPGTLPVLVSPRLCFLMNWHVEVLHSTEPLLVAQVTARHSTYSYRATGRSFRFLFPIASVRRLARSIEGAKMYLKMSPRRSTSFDAFDPSASSSFSQDALVVSHATRFSGPTRNTAKLRANNHLLGMMNNYNR